MSETTPTYPAGAPLGVTSADGALAIRAAVFAAAEASSPPTWAMFRQAQIESGFQIAAVSVDKAAGVLQIEPATGGAPGYGVPAISPADALDPYKATYWAGLYLTALYDQTAGKRWGVAFLQYNVGPGASVQTASTAYKQLAQYVALTLGEPDPLLVAA